jgi:hypothetical protein
LESQIVADGADLSLIGVVCPTFLRFAWKAASTGTMLNRLAGNKQLAYTIFILTVAKTGQPSVLFLNRPLQQVFVAGVERKAFLHADARQPDNIRTKVLKVL